MPFAYRSKLLSGVTSLACVSAILISALSFLDQPPRQVCAGSHVLADVHWHKLQYAIDAARTCSAIHLAPLQLIEGLLFIDFRLLRGESGFRRIASHRSPFSLQL